MHTATLPDRDQTPLTKEAVEREIRLLENNASDCHVRTETVAMLRALWGRVEELEKMETAARRLWMCDANGNRAEVYGACERARCKVYKFDAVLLQLGANNEALKGETTND